MKKEKQVRDRITVTFTDLTAFYSKCLAGRSEERIERYVDWIKNSPSYSKRLCRAVDQTDHGGVIKKAGLLDAEEMEVTELMKYVDITMNIHRKAESALYRNDYNFFKVSDKLVPYVSALDRVGDNYNREIPKKRKRKAPRKKKKTKPKKRRS